MRNIRAWLHNYENLNFEQKAEVAQEIVKYFENNQYFFMQKHEDITKIMNFFKRILESANQKNVINENESLLRRFEGLSQVNKEKALGQIINIINSFIKVQEQENNARICEQKGHLFNKWKYKTWTTSEVYWDAGPKGYIDVQHHEWSRTCSRCGYVEKSEYEPEEIKKERLQKEKEDRIKVLEKELKQLKGN